MRPDEQPEGTPENPCAVCRIETGFGNVAGATWWEQRLCYRHGVELEAEEGEFWARSLELSSEDFCREATRRAREWAERARAAFQLQPSTGESHAEEV